MIVGGDLREVLESDVLTGEGSRGEQVLELAGGEPEEGKHDWLLLFSEWQHPCNAFLDDVVRSNTWTRCPNGPSTNLFHLHRSGENGGVGTTAARPIHMLMMSQNYQY